MIWLKLKTRWCRCAATEAERIAPTHHHTSHNHPLGSRPGSPQKPPTKHSQTAELRSLLHMLTGAFLQIFLFYDIIFT